jgi:hypothetical protein
VATTNADRIAGGSFFFTVNQADRRQRLLTEHIDKLRAALSLFALDGKSRRELRLSPELTDNHASTDRESPRAETARSCRSSH